MAQYEWLTVHRLRYSQAFTAPEGLLQPSWLPSCWISGPSSPPGPDGMRTLRSEVFSAVGFYDTEEQAEEAFSQSLAGQKATVPVEEEWRGLLRAYAHRGDVNWFQSDPGKGIVPAGTDVGGPLMVITSAGYVTRDLPRIADFFANVDRVVQAYRGNPANFAAETYQMFWDNGRLDGMTFSIWPNDRAMMGAAYREGFHKEQLARHSEAPMADRTSFTRARILKSRGNWGNGDPVARMMAA